MGLCRTCENWTAVLCQQCAGELQARAEGAEAHCGELRQLLLHAGREASELQAERERYRGALGMILNWAELAFPIGLPPASSLIPQQIVAILRDCKIDPAELGE